MYEPLQSFVMLPHTFVWFRLYSSLTVAQRAGVQEIAKLTVKYEMLDSEVQLVKTTSQHRKVQTPVPVAARSTAARLLRSWVRISRGAWMSVCYECCMLSGRGLCEGLIIRSEESYRLWRDVVCDHETSQARWLKPARGHMDKEHGLSYWGMNIDWRR